MCIGSNTSRSPAQSCVKQLLSLHDYLHHADWGCRHVKLRKAILNAIKLAVSNGERVLVLSACSVIYVVVSNGEHAGSRADSSGEGVCRVCQQYNNCYSVELSAVVFYMPFIASLHIAILIL